MTALGVAIVGVGVLFVASGIKDMDPVAIALAILAGDPIPRARGGNATSSPTAPTAPTGNVGGTVPVRSGLGVRAGELAGRIGW